MTTMNREEQKQVLIDTANHIIHRDNTSPYSENLRELARIALASLEAEPVAKIIAHYPLGIDVGKQKFVQAIGELPDFGGHLFAVPPVPVVPEEKPMPNPLSMYAVDAVAAIAEVRGWNACRAAMLQKNANNTPECDNLVTELAMWVKRLVSQLKKAKPNCVLPDKAMNYLEQHRLVGVEDALR